MPRVALIFSASVFALTVLNICFFLIHAAFLQRLQRVSQGISDDKVRKFVNDEALQIQLNIGFLGLIFLCVSFSSLCYSYYLFFRTQDASAYQWKVNEAAIGQLDQQYELEESFERNDSEGDKDDPSGNPQKRFMYDKVDYNSFSNHTLREIKTCFPAFVQDRIGVGEPMFTVPKEALGLQIITWTFRKAFWGALIALIWAIAQPSRIFHAL